MFQNIASLSDRIELSNGTSMPAFGLGVFLVSNDEAPATVRAAGSAGYRLIDTAAGYQNEAGTGEGIRDALAENGLKREDLFVTSKVWNHNLSYEGTIAAYERSLRLLGLDYLDLFLIHWPGTGSFEANWKALEDLALAGVVKAIGVSNFHARHIDELKRFARVMPVINLIERHTELVQTDLLVRCREEKIVPQAWSPLMQGAVLKHPVVLEMAERYGRTPAQIVLRWDSDHDSGFVAGYRLKTEEPTVAAKGLHSFTETDQIQYTCSYYDYDFNYDRDYTLGDPVTYTSEPVVNYEEIGEYRTVIQYTLRDIYNNEHFTDPVELSCE